MWRFNSTRCKLIYLGYKYPHEMPTINEKWLADGKFQYVEIGRGYSSEEAVYDVLKRAKDKYKFTLSNVEQAELERNLHELVLGRYVESPEDKSEKDFRLGLMYYVVMLFKKDEENENEFDGKKV